jgi:nucleotide-binding universal stress UspA family protein
MAPAPRAQIGDVFEKVLLAVDGSDHSAKAVPVAADMAKKSDGEVVVFYVREYTVARVGRARSEDGLHAKELVDKVTAELTADGVKARGIVEPLSSARPPGPSWRRPRPRPPTRSS